MLVSIYATFFNITEPWPGKATVYPLEGEPYEVEDAYDDEEEERLGPPYRYDGSHVMPHENAPRVGDLELGFIPGHIWRDHDGIKVAAQPDEEVPHPYIRLGLMDKCFTGNDITVVLDREQVEALRDSLAAWLDWTQQSEPR